MQLSEVRPKLHELIIGDDDIEMTIPVKVPTYNKVLRAEQTAVGHRVGAIEEAAKNEAQAEVSYWRTIRSLLDAEAAVESTDVPDVDLPDTSKSVLLERCALVEEWAAECLRQAEEIKAQREEADAKEPG